MGLESRFDWWATAEMKGNYARSGRDGRASGKGSLSTDQAMVGVTKQHSFPAFQEHAVYETGIDIRISPPTKVTVTFPGFVVNDRPVGPREIRYRLDRHIQFMVPINC